MPDLIDELDPPHDGPGPIDTAISLTTRPETPTQDHFLDKSRPRRKDTRRARLTHNRPRRAIGLAVALPIVVTASIVIVVSITGEPWNGSHRSALALTILNFNLLNGPLPDLIYSLAILDVFVLLIRPLSRRWLVRLGISVTVGAVAAVLILIITSAVNTFGVALSDTTSAWAIATFAAVGLAIATLIISAPWRKAVAVIAIECFVLAGTVGINADFGLNKTIADFVGTSTAKAVALPKLKVALAPAMPLDGGALWANWKPPKNMPTAGTITQVVIPNTLSGFKSRPAGLYLPPAALVADPPSLPLMIMMMGQPGNPDPSFAGAILNQYAARHDGLAPIVLAVDQLGNPSTDPLCLDTTRHGNAQTFVTQDAVNWARTHLHVLQDAAHWVVAGYSNGGECALSFGAKFPQLWSNVLDISGEESPGSDRRAQTLATAFNGNSAAYAAASPIAILAATRYSNMLGIFTVGSNDRIYRPQALRVSAAAKAAGWATTYFEVPNGGHVLGALNGGLYEGFNVLYPKLGLSNPAATP